MRKLNVEEGIQVIKALSRPHLAQYYWITKWELSITLQ